MWKVRSSLSIIDVKVAPHPGDVKAAPDEARPLGTTFSHSYLNLMDQMESTVRSRVLTLICCMMVIFQTFFMLAMGELLKQTHTM